MSIWEKLLSGKIQEALADGLRKLFTSVSGIVLLLVMIATGLLIFDNNRRVTPAEHRRVLTKLDACEERERYLQDSFTNVLIFKSEAYSRQVRLFDSIAAQKELELQKRDFIIQQYENMLKTATK